MKISKFTLMVALAATLNLPTSSIQAMEEEQDVTYQESNEKYVPIVTPTVQTTRDVAHGTGRILEGTGEVITLKPGEGIEDIAGGTGEIVEGAVKAPARFLGIIRE